MESFNASNRWKKRGVGLTAAKYGISHGGVKASASIKVFQEDGTMLLNHSGCEIGQGLNTKVGEFPHEEDPLGFIARVSHK